MRQFEEVEIFWGNEDLATIASRLTVDRTGLAEKGDTANSENYREFDVAWGDNSDLTTLASRLTLDQETQTKNYLAYWIVAIFAMTLLLLIAGGVLIVLLRPLAESEQALLKTFVPFLQAVGNFMSTLFGPLLGFVLGYYFANSKGSPRLG